MQWFAAGPSVDFGKELAAYILGELKSSMHKRDGKFAVKAARVLVAADQKVKAFRQREKLNVYKKAKLANAFLWHLKDGGCPEDYAQELTDWLAERL